MHALNLKVAHVGVVKASDRGDVREEPAVSQSKALSRSSNTFTLTSSAHKRGALKYPAKSPFQKYPKRETPAQCGTGLLSRPVDASAAVASELKFSLRCYGTKKGL